MTDHAAGSIFGIFGREFGPEGIGPYTELQSIILPPRA